MPLATHSVIGTHCDFWNRLNDSLPSASACLSSSDTTSCGFNFSPSLLPVYVKGNLVLYPFTLSTHSDRSALDGEVICGTSSASDATTSPRTGTVASTILLMFFGWISK